MESQKRPVGLSRRIAAQTKGWRFEHAAVLMTLLTVACATGGDVPMRAVHSYFTTYDQLSGPLFMRHGPSPYDVRQGEVGSCWLLAAMAATAQQQPRMIREMFDRIDSKTYRVTFRDDAARSVVVSTDVPFRWFASEPLYAAARGAMWVSLLEKAYAKAFVPAEGYDGIGGDHPRVALARLTGWPVRDYDIDGDLSSPDLQVEWDHLLAAFRRGAPMVAGSRIAQVRADIVPMHAYAVTRIERDRNGAAFVWLYDPEGSNAYPNSELRLTFDEFVTYFYYVSIAQAEDREETLGSTL
jgi:hypothetical protein